MARSTITPTDELNATVTAERQSGHLIRVSTFRGKIGGFLEHIIEKNLNLTGRIISCLTITYWSGLHPVRCMSAPPKGDGPGPRANATSSAFVVV